jgi:endonuclease III
MTRKARYEAFVRYFSEHMPVAKTELEYRNPYELLVAVILSAQCTDKRVNMVMPGLMKAFPKPEVMAAASAEEIFPHIRSISYPNNKSKNLAGMARVLIKDFNGIVPSEVDQLTRLPGVGRKTANVIASVVYQKPAMAVDTHVFRVAARIGLTLKATTPLSSERQLVKFLPEEIIHKAHHWLILHGRYVCKARNPECNRCGITGICSYFGKSKRNVSGNGKIKR